MFLKVILHAFKVFPIRSPPPMNMKLIKKHEHFPRHIDVISRNIDHNDVEYNDLSSDSSDSSNSNDNLMPIQRTRTEMNIRYSASTSPSPNLHPTSFEFYLEQKYNNFDSQDPKLTRKYKKSRSSSPNNIYESFSPVAMDIELTSDLSHKRPCMKPKLTR